MTIADVIDELLLTIGLPEDQVHKARRDALMVHCQSTKAKANVERKLSQEEIEHYRKMVLLYFVAILTNPEFRDKVKAEVEKLRSQN